MPYRGVRDVVMTVLIDNVDNVINHYNIQSYSRLLLCTVYTCIAQNKTSVEDVGRREGSEHGGPWRGAWNVEQN